jgi:drug/metabolite transporter (DMT)-like permease
LLVGFGVIAVAIDGRPSGGGRLGHGVGYGLAIGATIAIYTVWDGYAVSRLAIPPLLQGWASEVSRATLLLPLAARRRAAVSTLWDQHRAALVAVGVLSPLAYLLVLITLSFSPVSAIAPAREVSILFGAILGSWLLHERHPARRLPAALMIVTGIVALALG